jgi:broad specificity phosphatase PhoE
VAELWLVRHGESQGNVDGSQADTPLSVRGEAQARSLGSILAAEEFALVFASPLVRARQTAELALPGAPIVIEPRLRELVTATKGFVDVRALGPERLKAFLERMRSEQAGSETGQEFKDRVRSWLAQLPRSGRVIAFSHFGVVRECLGQLGSRRAPEIIDHCSIHRAPLG